MLLAYIFLFYVPTCLADLADSDQPLHLEADQMLIDDMNQTSTFIGNVRLTQGTMLIRGNKIEVIQHKDGFKQAKIYGDTASFRQKREGSEEYLEGYGERIEYDTRAETVDFYVRALVKRESDEVRGDRITYNIKTGTFQVSSNPSATGIPPSRVRAVLQPKSTTDSQDALRIAPRKTLTSPTKHE
ncbi:MAG: lipopolysaccharide transport periplasmic protein LptA [Gallionella sp.]|jgi:lipopolysaccharide export system protein LptA